MRIEGWESQLNDYLIEMAGKPFDWGYCDCLLFASDWCLMACGVDPMSKKKKNDPDTIRGLYDSEESAKGLIREYRKSLRDIMDVHFNRVGVGFAQRGDIVLYKNAFGIVAGRGMAFFKTEDSGMLQVKLEDCSLAWHI